jgi:hypothetical protein
VCCHILILYLPKGIKRKKKERKKGVLENFHSLLHRDQRATNLEQRGFYMKRNRKIRVPLGKF